MKRLVLSITGTIAGLIALLSFKTETQPTAITGALPAAALGGQGSSTSTTTNTASSGAGTPSTSSRSSAPSSEASTGSAGSAGSTGSAGSAGSTAKAYLGSAITTRYGVIQVKVTVRAKKITNVSFAQLTADDGRSAQINSDAAPQLLQETLSAQSANVDTISGASYTSDGYRQSLQSALDEAGI